MTASVNTQNINLEQALRIRLKGAKAPQAATGNMCEDPWPSEQQRLPVELQLQLQTPSPGNYLLSRTSLSNAYVTA